MTKTVRRLGRGALVLAALMLSGASFAQSFPSKPIRLVVPFGPVGMPDVLARLVAQKISDTTGQQVIVDNKPGAGGVIAAQFLAKAEPGGYTLILIENVTYAVNPALFPKLPYNPSRDFAPVTLAVRGPFFLVANPSLGVHSVQELIALAKTRPGINYGSPGNGQQHHLTMEQFALMAGVSFTHVPYKGVLQATPALVAGDVSLMFLTLPSMAALAKAGKLRILAVTSAQRSLLMPEVPTVAEAGFAGFEAVFNMGFAAPAATPRAIVERLNTLFVDALKSPEVESKMLGFGVEMVAGTPEQFAEQIRKDQEHFARLVSQTGLKAD